jgi:hypothetical protein
MACQLNFVSACECWNDLVHEFLQKFEDHDSPGTVSLKRQRNGPDPEFWLL